MRWLFVSLVVLALFSVALLVSNAGSADRYALKVAGQVLVEDTPVTLVVVALFAGAAIAGLPLALSNWWLRRKVGQLERRLRLAQGSPQPAPGAPAAPEEAAQTGGG